MVTGRDLVGDPAVDVDGDRHGDEVLRLIVFANALPSPLASDTKTPEVTTASHSWDPRARGR